MGEDAAVCVDLCVVDCSHIDCVCWAEAEVLSYSFFFPISLLYRFQFGRVLLD